MSIPTAAKRPDYEFQGDHPYDPCAVCGDPQAPTTAASWEGLHLPKLPSRLCPDHGYALYDDVASRCLQCPGSDL